MPKKPKDTPTGLPDVDDDLLGTNSGETILGDTGDDTISGKNGDDSLFGEEGADTLYGGNGKDALYGGPEDDLLPDPDPDPDNDILNGGNGKDSLYGGDDDDTLYGGNGKDLLDGGKGDDHLYGDKGKDSFKFGTFFGDDIIYDFKDGKEKIDLTAFGVSFGFDDIVQPIGVSGGDAVISVSGHGTITVVGAAGLIDESDFIFAA